MASGGEGDQSIVLKLTPLVYIPVPFVADNSHKPTCLPPVGNRRLPADGSKFKKARDEPLCVTIPRSSTKLR